jgi:tetratricopeptide (TPR) repeat protein
VTYRNDSVAALANEIVFVKVNAEKDTATSHKYGVAGFPTVVMTKPDGSEIDRIYGYAGPKEFLNIIRDYQAGRNTLPSYLLQAETAPTPALYYLIADKYIGRKKFVEGETYLNKIMAMDPKNEKGYSDSALSALADMKTRAKEYDAAKEAYKKLMEMYPQSGLVDDALFGVAAVNRRAEKYDEAIAGFKLFMSVHPQSELVPDAAAYIAICTEKKGDTTAALQLYERYLIDFPKSEDTTWVKSQIQRIKNPPADQKGK